MLRLFRTDKIPRHADLFDIGYEGLIAAQDCLPKNDTRDRFVAATTSP